MSKHKFIIKGEVGAQTKERAENKLLDMIEDWAIDAKVEMLSK